MLANIFPKYSGYFTPGILPYWKINKSLFICNIKNWTIVFQGSNCSKRLDNSSGQTEKPKRRREEPQGQENSVHKKETIPSGGIYQEVPPQQGHNGYNDHLQNSYNEQCQHGGNSAGCPLTGKTCYQESNLTNHFIESQPVGCNQDVNYPRYGCRDNQQKMPVQATKQIQLIRSSQGN